MLGWHRTVAPHRGPNNHIPVIPRTSAQAARCGTCMVVAAGAYDLVARGEAASVILADADAGRAAAAAERVNRLTGGDAARPALLDATDGRAVRAMLEPLDAIVS